MEQALGLAFIGAGFGAGLIVFGAAMGIGRLATGALESMARQPEMSGDIRTAMIIAAALIEGFTFFALVVTFMLATKEGGVQTPTTPQNQPNTQIIPPEAAYAIVAIATATAVIAILLIKRRNRF